MTEECSWIDPIEDKLNEIGSIFPGGKFMLINLSDKNFYFHSFGKKWMECELISVFEIGKKIAIDQIFNASEQK